MAAVRADRLFEERTSQAGDPVFLDQLPFVAQDATGGSEDELRAVVAGASRACDLPLTIRESRFFHNIARRSASGEAPQSTLAELNQFLADTRCVWENSWIRFPESSLSERARQVFCDDLQVPVGDAFRNRSDAPRFRFPQNGEPWLRLPISYALKLALADVAGRQPHLPQVMRDAAGRLTHHFINDNTSPETTSFQVQRAAGQRSLGRQIAREAARRFLFTTLLAAWINRSFGLLESGQRAVIYHSPMPSVHQEELSSSISDSFYRELFMSPCLSGWINGEEKHQYMHLCHQALTRSQLNAVAKLREAGIIAHNLIVLPRLSNVSLATNGIHISMGSRLLQEQARAGPDRCREAKQLGDLAIKVYEHFLAAFVGLYSAAPQRIAFTQFHPELLLSFLPHELDFTHLRLMWREWKEKADIRLCGRPLTPYGPRWLDRLVAGFCRLRGDSVPDMRLLTYPVAWLATENAPALDGIAGNTLRLSTELDELGIVDRRMSFYMPVRLRDLQRDGYCGFEARYYSLFPTYDSDMAPAADLQQLLLALAYKLVIDGEVGHEDIPDDPTSESERRQPFFFAAAGLPAFYVARESRNQFLGRLLLNCKRTRTSRRHPGFIRVSVRDYRRALLEFIQANAAGLIEALNLQPVVADLAWRCDDQQQHAAVRLTEGVLHGTASKPMQVEAREFNVMAEDFYREPLRQAHLREAMQHLREDVAVFERCAQDEERVGLRHGVRVQNIDRFLADAEKRVLHDELTAHEIMSMLNILLLLIAHEHRANPSAA